MKRPHCARCGKPYGNRHAKSVTVKWPIGESMPPYRGNGKVIEQGVTYQTLNRDAARKLRMLSVNPTIRAAQELDLAKISETSQNVSTFWVWDGETWAGGYKPFCTLRCALDYARKAYDARLHRRAS